MKKESPLAFLSELIDGLGVIVSKTLGGFARRVRRGDLWRKAFGGMVGATGGALVWRRSVRGVHVCVCMCAMNVCGTALRKRRREIALQLRQAGCTPGADEGGGGRAGGRSCDRKGGAGAFPVGEGPPVFLRNCRCFFCGAASELNPARSIGIWYLACTEQKR